MVSRLESFGLQNSEEWDYFSRPGLSREPRYSNRGSAHGGLVFLPPQLTIADYVADRQASVSASTATFIIADSTRLGIGTPSVTEEGGLSQGFYEKYDTTNNLLGTYRYDDTRFMHLEHSGSKRVVMDRPLNSEGCLSIAKTAAKESGSPNYSLTPSSSNITVQAYSGTSGYLYKIDATSVSDGQLLFMRPYNDSSYGVNSIYVTDASYTSGGNIKTLGAGSYTITMGGTGKEYHQIGLIYDATEETWNVISNITS